MSNQFHSHKILFTAVTGTLCFCAFSLGGHFNHVQNTSGQSNVTAQKSQPKQRQSNLQRQVSHNYVQQKQPTYHASTRLQMLLKYANTNFTKHGVQKITYNNRTNKVHIYATNHGAYVHHVYNQMQKSLR